MKRIILLTLSALLLSHFARAKEYPITTYGAIPGGKVLCTEAIQKAIDQCHFDGGGTVVIPPGTFLTGRVELKSHVNLFLENGSELLASDKKEDYQPGSEHYSSHLITAWEAEDISITGQGTITGTGSKDLGVPRISNHYSAPDFRPGIIRLSHCRNVLIRDITLRHSDMFSLVPEHCTDVKILGITIDNNYYRANSDGIDPGHCTNLVIAGCRITAGDDCICFKNAVENVTVSNCILETPASAIKFGTSTADTFRNIVITNCVVKNSMTGFGIYMKDGGLVEDVSCSNMIIETIRDTNRVNSGIANQIVPVYIDIDYRNKNSEAGTVRNIAFSDILVKSSAGILVQGMKVKPVENITFNNIRFRPPFLSDLSIRKKPKGFADSKFYYHPDDRLTEFARKRSMLVVANCNGLSIDGFQLMLPENVPSDNLKSAIYLENCHDDSVENIRVSGNKEMEGTRVVNSEGDEMP